MTKTSADMYLYEALELRAEYLARLASLKALLPEKKTDRRGLWGRDTNERVEPAAGFDIPTVREKIRKLEYKSRKLNTAIQQINFTNEIEIDGEKMSIAETLEMRKSVDQEIADMQKILEESAYKTIIYKEERNIVEEPDIDFAHASEQLEERRLLFRRLNRALRRAAYTVTVPFIDEA